MNDIFSVIEGAVYSSKPCVLATIIHVEGSAYLKEGTSCVFFQDGSKIGLISPGCIEEDLLYKVKEVLDAGKSQTVIYNLIAENDPIWGQEIGCGGTIYVLLERVDHGLKENLCRVYKQLQNGVEVLHIKKLTAGFNVESSCYLTKNGQLFGDSNLETLKIKWGMHSGTNVTNLVYYHTFTPRRRLILFGAGLDAKPLVELASQTGFAVTICDWRESLCTKENFPNAEKFVIGFPNDIFQELSFNKEDCVILMTHNFIRDQEIISFLLEKKLRYFGVLGSKQRIDLLFDRKNRPIWVSAPIGLPIGAKGPIEIAISVLAEMILMIRQPLWKEGTTDEHNWYLSSCRPKQKDGEE